MGKFDAFKPPGMKKKSRKKIPKVLKTSPEKFRVFGGKRYVRISISAYVYKKDAKEKADAYRSLGIPARVWEHEGRYWVYVNKAIVKRWNKYLAREYRVY